MSDVQKNMVKASVSSLPFLQYILYILSLQAQCLKHCTDLSSVYCIHTPIVLNQLRPPLYLDWE